MVRILFQGSFSDDPPVQHVQQAASNRLACFLKDGPNPPLPARTFVYRAEVVVSLLPIFGSISKGSRRGDNCKTRDKIPQTITKTTFHPVSLPSCLSVACTEFEQAHPAGRTTGGTAAARARPPLVAKYSHNKRSAGSTIHLPKHPHTGLIYPSHG